MRWSVIPSTCKSCTRHVLPIISHMHLTAPPWGYNWKPVKGRHLMRLGSANGGLISHLLLGLVGSFLISSADGATGKPDPTLPVGSTSYATSSASSAAPCGFLVNTGYQGDCCCHQGSATCGGTCIVVTSYACSGTCPNQNQTCEAIATANLIVKIERTCQGTCPGSTCDLTSQIITCGNVPSECDCVEPT